MTRDEFRKRLAMMATREEWVEDMLLRIVVMMREFGIPDPNFCLSMPCTTFDEVWRMLIVVRKKESEAASQQIGDMRERKQKHGFG